MLAGGEGKADRPWRRRQRRESQISQTAVHFAAEAADVNLPQPSDDMVRLLAEHGAKLDVADKQGRTPVEMAQGKGLRGRAGGPVAPREMHYRSTALAERQDHGERQDRGVGFRAPKNSS